MQEFNDDWGASYYSTDFLSQEQWHKLQQEDMIAKETEPLKQQITELTDKCNKVANEFDVVKNSTDLKNVEKLKKAYEQLENDRVKAINDNSRFIADNQKLIDELNEAIKAGWSITSYSFLLTIAAIFAAGAGAHHLFSTYIA